jgi:hypothetical protein
MNKQKHYIIMESTGNTIALRSKYFREVSLSNFKSGSKTQCKN